VGLGARKRGWGSSVAKEAGGWCGEHTTCSYRIQEEAPPCGTPPLTQAPQHLLMCVQPQTSLVRTLTSSFATVCTVALS
jgi:hypothetical protein